MTKQEFIDEVMLGVAMTLPPSFGDAGMELKEVSGFNDVTYTALLIQRENEPISPSINLDDLYLRHEENDMTMGQIVQTIVEIKLRDNTILESLNMEALRDYEEARYNLDIRLCDKDFNHGHLTEAVSKDFGDYTATYRICLSSNDEHKMSTAVTPYMLEQWGITVDQLHQDAMYNQQPKLYVLTDMLSSMMFGEEPKNLLEDPHPMEGLGGLQEIPMLILTNESQLNGSSVILDPEILKKTCEIAGGNGFLLPSSINECIFVPEMEGVQVSELLTMVSEVNATEVSDREILSDKVQHVDKETGLFQNAEIWAKEMAQQKQAEMDRSNPDHSQEKNRKGPEIQGPKL